MTTSEPDPRTDLAGWLGLDAAQEADCRRSATFFPGSVYTLVGARLIAQDQADTPDPDPDDDNGHRPIGPDGKHGTRRCTPTCGCIDKGPIASTVPEPVEGPPGTVPVTLWLDEESDALDRRYLRFIDGVVIDFEEDDWYRGHGVPVPDPPAPPWTDPWGLGLTEEEARVIVKAPSGGGAIGAGHAKIAAALRPLLPEEAP